MINALCLISNMLGMKRIFLPLWMIITWAILSLLFLWLFGLIGMQIHLLMDCSLWLMPAVMQILMLL